MKSQVPGNRLLASLPRDDFERLSTHMTEVEYDHKQTVYWPNQSIEHVYFPHTGLISAVIVMADGSSAEVAVVGREGLLGASVVLGAKQSTEHVYCQVHPSLCSKLSVVDFLAEVSRGGILQTLVYAYLRAALTVSARQTACNCLRMVEERCARWLLMCHDRAGSDEFPLTHEFLAIMLGVRRASVTVTARGLQQQGFISYKHGRVTMLDRSGLEQAACECYQAIRDAFVYPTT